MKHYYAHGLGILSEIHFPEFKTKKTNIDLIIQYGLIEPYSDNYRDFYLSELTKVRVTSNETYLFWNDALICCIEDCQKIIVNPHTGLDEDFLRLLILGYAFAIFLHQMGTLVLHANAVNMFGGAIVFLGDRGKGKSTTSLILNKKGYSLISDDVLSISVNNDIPRVYSGFPRLKLWPEVIRKLDEDPELMPQISFNSEKRSYFVNDNFSNISLPLKFIYLIERSDETKIESINIQEGLMELVKSSYCYKLFNNLELYENLKQCTEILNKVPLKRLYIKHSLDELPAVVKIIEKDILKNSK